MYLGHGKGEKIMAKKLSPKQKKLARVEAPRNKITEADFNVLKKSNAQKNTNRRKKA